MEYPGSILKKRYRHMILASFIAVFCLLSPLIILYTAGYRYDFKNGIIKETGAISIDLKPITASVFINEQKIREKIPIKLNAVSPNHYTIRITAPGYYDWQKDVEVKNKQTVYIKDVVMIKKDKPTVLLKDPSVTNLFLSPNGDYLIYVLSSTDKQHYKLKAVRQNSPDITILSTAPQEQLSVTWSPRGTYFSIHSKNAPYQRFMIFETLRPEVSDDVNKIMNTKKIEKFRWRDSATAEVYVGTSSTIYSFQPLQKQLRKLTQLTYLDWDVANDQLWTLSAAPSSSQLIITKDILGTQSEVTRLDGSLSLQTAPRIVQISQNNILLNLSSPNEHVLITSQKKQFPLTTNQMFISPFNNWWLLWNPWELWTYVDGEKPLLFNRSGEQLFDVIPLDVQNTLLLKWKDKSTVIFPYYFVQHELITTPTISIVADTKNRILYFSGAINDESGIWKLNY
jgi:hypothetical protein